jgi:hypothetical protein
MSNSQTDLASKFTVDKAVYPSCFEAIAVSQFSSALPRDGDMIMKAGCASRSDSEGSDVLLPSARRPFMPYTVTRQCSVYDTSLINSSSRALLPFHHSFITTFALCLALLFC